MEDTGEGPSRLPLRFGDHNGGIQFGVCNDRVTVNNTVAPAKIPRDPTKGIYTVPHSTDPAFVARDDLLNQVRAKVFPAGGNRGGRAALVGWGGMGKTQMAIAFAEETRQRHPERSVFWMNGATRDRLEEEFRTLADILDLDHRNDRDIYIPQLVHDWLRNGSNGSWLVIVDSCDDIDVLYAVDAADDERTPRRRPLATYLPTSVHGAMLATTRSETVGSKLAGGRSQLIRIGTMSEREALDVFRKKHGGVDEGANTNANADSVVMSLVKELGFMPLAISQAATYIVKHEPYTSAQQYLDDFGRSEKHQASLLGETEEVRQADGKPNSVFTTWQMTFDYLQKRHPSAAGLLSLMSLFDAQSIPTFALSVDTRGIPSRVQMERAYITESTVENDIAVLRDYRLVSVNEYADIWMHSLVQLATRTWLRQHGQYAVFESQFCMHVWSSIYNKYGECCDYVTWKKIVPQVLHAVKQISPTTKLHQFKVFLLCYGARIAQFHGDVATSIAMATSATKIAESQSEFRFDDSFAWLALTDIKFFSGDCGKCECLLLKILASVEKYAGKNEPWVLIMHRLERVYLRQKRLEDAERIRAQLPRENLTERLRSASVLAKQYINEARNDNAERLLLQAIHESRDAPGMTPLILFEATTTLVEAYYGDRRYDDAETQLLSWLAMPESDAEMKDVTEYLLAITYFKQGRYKDAETLLLGLLLEQSARPYNIHRLVPSVVVHLSIVYGYQGRDKDKKLILEKYHHIGLESENPEEYLRVSVHLAQEYYASGQHVVGISLMEDCVRRSERAFGAEDALTIERAGLLKEMKKYEQRTLGDRQQMLTNVNTRRGRRLWKWW